VGVKRGLYAEDIKIDPGLEAVRKMWNIAFGLHMKKWMPL